MNSNQSRRKIRCLHLTTPAVGLLIVHVGIEEDLQSISIFSDFVQSMADEEVILYHSKHTKTKN